MVVKNVNIQDTVDTVEMFLYDMAGKNTFDDIVESHVSYLFFLLDISCLFEKVVGMGCSKI